MSDGDREASGRRPRTPAHLIRWLAAGGALIVLLVTTTSALLRVSGAGLGCADWPACYGRTDERRDPPRLARLLHRVAASGAGAVVLGIGLLAIAQPRRHRHELAVFTVLAGLALGLATLGRATPGALVPAVAMGNVLGGMLMASLLAWLALGNRSRGERSGAEPADGSGRASGWLRWLAALALALAFIAIALGVMTSASYSGLACPGLPACTGNGSASDWDAADLDPWRLAAGSPTIHMAHRAAAVLAGAAALALAWSIGRLDRAGQRLRNLLLAALALQFLLGIGLVELGLPLPLAVLHNLGAAALLLVLVATQHHLVPSARAATAREGRSGRTASG